jgi:hypothetical protein
MNGHYIKLKSVLLNSLFVLTKQCCFAQNAFKNGKKHLFFVPNTPVSKTDSIPNADFIKD